MITLALATAIAAPREPVWSALTDPEQIPRWRPGVEAALLDSAASPAALAAPAAGPAEAGRRLRFRCRLHGVPIVLEEVVVEALPGERLLRHVRLGLFHCEETFSLAAAGPGGRHTRVSLRIAAPSETPLVGASLDRFAVRRFATDLAGGCLQALRAWCEHGRTPAPAPLGREAGHASLGRAAVHAVAGERDPA